MQSSQKGLPEKLELTKIQAYSVMSEDSERSSSLKGLYTHASNAGHKKKAAGWFGQDGTIQTLDVFIDKDNRAYEVRYMGTGYFDDDTIGQSKLTMEIIKSKLTEEEIKFLNL
jgi:hypothetical protein